MRVAGLIALALLCASAACTLPEAGALPAAATRRAPAPGPATPARARPTLTAADTPLPPATAFVVTPAPAPATPVACARPEDYTLQSDYLGTFSFDPIGTQGASPGAAEAIRDTRIIIRSAPVAGSPAVQFAFWFQGRTGGPAGVYLSQLRLMAVTDCLDPASGAGTLRILPALRPGDYRLPAQPFGETSQAGLNTADPYDFRLYLLGPGGSPLPESTPIALGFVTGGVITLTHFGPSGAGWEAGGIISTTLVISSGGTVPPITGQFDAGSARP